MTWNEPSHRELWPFALAVYGLPGVSSACLVLQEEAGADVPMILWALWIGAGGIALTDSEMSEAQMAVGLWHNEIVTPLRTVRRRMKTGPFPAPSDETETLRKTLKAVELGAEKIEMAVLASLVPDTGTRPAYSALDAMRLNLDALLGSKAENFSIELDHVATAACTLIDTAPRAQPETD